MCRRKNSCCPEMYVTGYPKETVMPPYYNNIPIPAGKAKVYVKSDWLGGTSSGHWTLEWTEGGTTDTHRALSNCGGVFLADKEADKAAWMVMVSPAYLAWLHFKAKSLHGRPEGAEVFVKCCLLSAAASPQGAIPEASYSDILDLFHRSFRLISRDEKVEQTIMLSGDSLSPVSVSAELEFIQDWD